MSFLLPLGAHDQSIMLGGYVDRPVLFGADCRPSASSLRLSFSHLSTLAFITSRHQWGQREPAGLAWIAQQPQVCVCIDSAAYDPTAR
mmetsp:Transcript_52401/g.132462  ORF Transcript_52401/g.132462 Transcript_52401/m.132462 type:complete len:88 (+) Transcript_52401:24-287(+)